MKNSRSKKALEALIALIGLGFLAFTYVYGVSAIKAETEAIASSNLQLRNQADAYMMLYTHQAEYAKQTAEMKSQFEGLENSFVKGIITEDEIVYMATLEDRNEEQQLVLNYINMGYPTSSNYMPPVENNAAFATGAIAMPSVNDDGIELYSYPIDFGFNVTYQGFKDVVNYLNTVGTKKKITGVTIAFDNSTGILNGILSFEEYALIGTGKEYYPLTIPTVPVTVENIFGTIELPEEDETTSPKED